MAAPAYVGDDLVHQREQTHWFGGMVAMFGRRGNGRLAFHWYKRAADAGFAEAAGKLAGAGF